MSSRGRLSAPSEYLQTRTYDDDRSQITSEVLDMTIAQIEPPEPMTERQLPPSMAERITLIIDLFETPFHRLALEDIARRTGLPRSTAHRILDQLIALDWVDHTRDGYGLGRRATRLIGGNDHTALRAAAAPLLHALALRTDLVVHLAVLDHQDVLYLDKVGGARVMAVSSRVGGRAPAHSTALGKAMLAWLDPEHVDGLLSSPLRRMTERTVTDLGELHLQLAAVRRRNGLAYEQGECTPGVDCIAAAIRNGAGPVAAVSLVGPSGAPLERLAPLAVDAVRRIATELFGHRSETRGSASGATPAPRDRAPDSRKGVLALAPGGGWH
jgi:DNA-binding IclR family transcriptional regulator